MFNKQIRIINKKQVDTLLFTSEQLQSGINPLHMYKADQAKRLVQQVPTKLPPYNWANPSNMDVSIRPHGAKDLVKRMMGATDSQRYKNIEQYVGVVDKAKLETGLPCMSVVYLFNSPVDNSIMLVGKLISSLQGRRYMYTMLNMLSAKQNQENASGNQMPEQYLGIAKNRAVTQKNEYELICDFAVSLKGLRYLDENRVGYMLDVTALGKFDYELAGIISTRPPEAAFREVRTFAKSHNDTILAILKQEG